MGHGCHDCGWPNGCICPDRLDRQRKIENARKLVPPSASDVFSAFGDVLSKPPKAVRKTMSTHPIDDPFTPLSWLCATLDLTANSFRVLTQSDDFVTVLHKETGAVWKFSVEVVREPV